MSLFRNLTPAQQEYLERHVDGEWPVECEVNITDAPTRKSLLEHGFIRYGRTNNKDRSQSITTRPRYTVLTEKGREMLCILLGDEADRLVNIMHSGRILTPMVKPPLARIINDVHINGKK